MEPRIYDLDEISWQALRQDLTRGVLGKSLLPAGLAADKLVLTRVSPGGEFFPHQDPYHHVFFFWMGKGEGWMGDRRFEILPGRVAEIPSGMKHGYSNTGDQDLILLTVNIPVEK